MNYLVLSDRFFGDLPGGAYRVAWGLARLMASRGNQVTLLCGSDERDPPSGTSLVEGVRLVRYRLPPRVPLDPLRWRRQVGAARREVERLLAQGTWQVIHAHSPMGAAAAFPLARPPTRLVCTVHSPVVQEQRINWNNGTLAGRLKLLLGLPVLRRAERDALARASAVHVLSTFTATELERQYGREATKRIRVIPWWPDHPWEILPREEARRRFGLPAGERVFLSIRRMVPRMGLRLLLDAAEGLGRDRPFKLLLAGDGPERTALEARARTERLRDRVVFLGRVSDEVAGWAYDACEAFVLPSLSLECFGIIVLEALAHGRPVIGSRVGAIPELLGPVLPDWLFEAGDSTALRNKLEAVLEGRLKAPSPDALEAHVAREFSIDRLSPRYISLLSSEGAGG